MNIILKKKENGKIELYIKEPKAGAQDCT